MFLICILVHTISGIAAVAPSIESSSDGSVTITVAEGTSVFVQTTDTSGKKKERSALITAAVLEQLLEDAKATMREEMQAALKEAGVKTDEVSKSVTTMQSSMAEIATNFTGIATQFDIAYGDMQSSTETVLTQATDAIQVVADDLDRAIDDLSSVSSKADSCLGSIAHSLGGTSFDSCPDTDKPKQCTDLSSITAGTVHGTDRQVGATRGFRCNDGAVMVGKAHSYCGEDLEWSPAPPKCEAQIDCAIFIDNEISGVYVDGQQVKVTCSQYAYWGSVQCAFSFPSSATTLAISGGDHEKGCKDGGMMLSCGSALQSNLWTTVTSSIGTKDNAANKWKAFGSGNQVAFRNDDWAQPDFDDSKWPKPVKGGKTYSGCAKKTSDGRKFQECSEVRDQGPSIYCRSNECNDDSDIIHEICADETSAFNSNGDRTYWWFRYIL